MIYGNVYDIVPDDVFLDLAGFVDDVRVLLKLEGLNPAGSIKLKTAVALIEDGEAAGRLRRGSRLIESSSGNLGIALATVCAAKGYRLTVVTDPTANPHAVRAMRALGAEVVVVTTVDENGGYLHSRLAYVADALSGDPELVWPNQYANAANVAAHRERTARSIFAAVSAADALIVGVGTGGTLVGCVEFYRRHSPGTRIVAVDAEGSVIFGGQAGRRRIPGIGASRSPEILLDHVDVPRVLVRERDTIAMCQRVARDYGLLVGGSTGSVLVAAQRIGATLPSGSRIVAVSPDLGDRYLDSVYDETWAAEPVAGFGPNARSGECSSSRSSPAAPSPTSSPPTPSGPSRSSPIPIASTNRA